MAFINFAVGDRSRKNGKSGMSLSAHVSAWKYHRPMIGSKRKSSWRMSRWACGQITVEAQRECVWSQARARPSSLTTFLTSRAL